MRLADRRIKPTYPEHGRKVCAKIGGSCEIKQVFEASTAALMANARDRVEREVAKTS